MPNLIRTLTAVALGLAALITLYHLLSLQYESGEGYPEYSSLRTDPLGTMALYEALDSISETQVERNMKELGRAQFTPDTTLFLLGASLGKDSVPTLERLEAFVEAGGRLVILFRPYTNPWLDEFEPTDHSSEEDDEEEDTPESEDFMIPFQDISERWGFEYAERNLTRNSDSPTTTFVQRNSEYSGVLPDALSWHSNLYFKDISNDWTSVFTRDTLVVAMERQMGEGTIVLASDNYHVTNEAMLKARSTDYLVWLTNSSHTVIFDESHLGIAPRMGLMALMALMIHYKLLPTLIACLFLAGLFVWRNTSRQIRHEIVGADTDNESVSFGSVESLASLARRSIPRNQILPTCWAMFKEGPGRSALSTKQATDEIEGLLASTTNRRMNDDTIKATYNAVCSILNERKRQK